MLNVLREATRSWIAGVFIGLLALSFAVWGINDIFTGGNRSAVATAGDEDVSPFEFSRAFEQALFFEGQRTGAVPSREQAREQGLDQLVLQQLVRNAALRDAARGQGLVVSDRAIAQHLAEIPNFVNPQTGGFDMQLYRRVLANQNLTPDRYETLVRNDMLADQFLGSVSGGVSVPRVLAELRARHQSERRQVTILSIPPSAAPDPGDPAPDALEAHYQANLARYTTPERRAFTLFLLEADQLISGIDVPEDALQALYEERRDELGAPERRTVWELSARQEAVAAEAAERLAAGEDPVSVAEALGMPEPIEHVNVTRSAFLEPAVAEVAFATTQGEVSDPFEGSFAWKVVQVQDVQEGRTLSFADAEPLLRAELATDDALNLLFDYVIDFDRQAVRGVPIEDAANSVGAAAMQVLAVTREGVDETGFAHTTLIERDAILETVFALGQGETSNLEELGETGYFTVTVTEIVPPTPRPLDVVSSRVAEDWADAQRDEALDAMRAEAQATLLAGGDFAAAAAAAHPSAEIREALLIRRLGVLEGVDPAAERDIFDNDPGFVATSIGGDGARMLVRLDDIVSDRDPPPETLAQAGQALAQSLDNDMAALLRASLIENARVRINDPLLSRIVGADTPS